MSDDSTKTMWATFATREAADRAVEHLVQQCGIARTDARYGGKYGWYGAFRR